MAQQPTTENMKIKIGGTYTYTNAAGYTTRIIVTRVTKNGVFATWANGTGEHREGVKNFSKYKLEK